MPRQWVRAQTCDPPSPPPSPARGLSSRAVDQVTAQASTWPRDRYPQAADARLAGPAHPPSLQAQILRPRPRQPCSVCYPLHMSAANIQPLSLLRLRLAARRQMTRLLLRRRRRRAGMPAVLLRKVRTPCPLRTGPWHLYLPVTPRTCVYRRDIAMGIVELALMGRTRDHWAVSIILGGT